jgi:hypothetical protein
MRLTECSSASRGSTPSPHDGAAVLERDSGVMGDRLEQRAVVVGERRVAIGDELADHAALPAQRRAHRMLAGAAPGPRDPPVLEHECGAGGADGVHRRLDDLLERLLEVQRLRDGFADARERLELGDPTLRLRVELRVQQRLRDLVGDRLQQLDLGLVVRALLARADVERAGELLAARQDRHREDRFVFLLRQVREELEPRVEVRGGRDHHGRALGGGGAGDAFARTHPRAPGHLLDARPVCGAQDELVAALVIEVDEAGVGLERGGDLLRDEVEDFLEVERRIDGGRRFGQQPKVPLARIHGNIVGSR